MPTKKHRPEEIIGKLREAEVMLAQGATTADPKQHELRIVERPQVDRERPAQRLSR